MTYSINWPITVRSAIVFHSRNYIFPLFCHAFFFTEAASTDDDTDVG